MIFIAALSASGCASPSAYSVVPPVSVGNSVRPDGSQKATYIAARDFIVGGALPENHGTFPMYAVVALSNDSSGNRKRSRWVCETFVNLPLVSILSSGGVGSVSQDQITPTYWLLKEDVDRKDCKVLAEQYDYERAMAIFSLAGRSGQSGTMLIAYRDNKIAVLDISKAGKRWTKAIVAKWSEAVRANRMQDITVRGGLIADTCAIITGDESQRVEAAVYEVVKSEFGSSARWYDNFTGVARDFAFDLMPFGQKIERLTSMSCDKVNNQTSTVA